MTTRYGSSVAFVMGKKLAEANPGRVLVIQNPDYGSRPKGGAADQMSAFKKGLGSVKPEIVMYIPQVPSSIDEEEIDEWYERPRWRKDFHQWYPDQGEFDALVALSGMPNFPKKSFVETFPPVYLRFSGNLNVDELGVTKAEKLVGYSHLRSDITSEHQVTPNTSMQKVFDSRYKWVDVE